MIFFLFLLHLCFAGLAPLLDDLCVLLLVQLLLFPDDHLAGLFLDLCVFGLSLRLQGLRLRPVQDLLHRAIMDIVNDYLPLLRLLALHVVNLRLLEEQSVRLHPVLFQRVG